MASGFKQRKIQKNLIVPTVLLVSVALLFGVLFFVITKSTPNNEPLAIPEVTTTSTTKPESKFSPIEGETKKLDGPVNPVESSKESMKETPADSNSVTATTLASGNSVDPTVYVVNPNSDKSAAQLPEFNKAELLSCKNLGNGSVEVVWKSEFITKGQNWYKPSNMIIDGNSFTVVQQFSASTKYLMLDRFQTKLTTDTGSDYSEVVSYSFLGVETSKVCK